ncbi:hypothetical protein MCAG_05632 [Micromonospora sp. ATCC 39149]|uniref:hypothetical protein n=1 Tax=Micromonospora sp. (strain ATCC 39149 / NRRL 15099 / SCC 1413) TaxID=219305 RepID=UPI0001A50946|nr:hypothetical protein [Micromonospora sp. ATCC 39149]EEP75305.1 hypothetical protein MCAG_05632 [Micromonospora sp. ATCC 39149]
MSSFLLAATSEGSADWSSSKLIIPVVAALLGFVSGYLLEIVKSKRGSRTVLAWDLKIEQPELSYGATQAERIKISYRGREVDRLITVRYTVTNTGNTSIKNQLVRFAFPQDAQILQQELDPRPEPEMGVRDITDEDPNFVGPRYKIGHLDPGDSVGFAFAADGGTWHSWGGAKLRNEETDVVYQRRDVALNRDDQMHVAPFLFGLAAILIITTLTGAASLAIWIVGKFYISDLTFFGVIIFVTLLFAAVAAYLLSHARRATKSIARRWTAGGRGDASLIANGNSWFAYAPSGVVHITPSRLDQGDGGSA